MKRIKLTKPCYKCGGSHYMKAGGSFEPHMMYDPKTGKGVNAETHEDHLALKDQGFLHEDEMEMKAGGTVGMCTGSKFGGPDCPKGSPQYNLATTFRKMNGKDVKKQYGGDIAEQNRSVNSITGDRKNMFMDYVSNNAQNAIMEEGLIEQQNMMTKQMYYNGGNTWMRRGAAKDINLANQMYADNQEALSGTFGNFADAAGDLDFSTETQMYFDVKGKDEIGKQKRKETKDWYKDYTKEFKKQTKEYNKYGPDAYNYMGPSDVPDTEMRYGGMPEYNHGGQPASTHPEKHPLQLAFDPASKAGDLSNIVDMRKFLVQSREDKLANSPETYDMMGIDPSTGQITLPTSYENQIVNDATVRDNTAVSNVAYPNNQTFIPGPIQYMKPDAYTDEQNAEYAEYLKNSQGTKQHTAAEYFNNKKNTASTQVGTSSAANTGSAVNAAVGNTQATKSGKTASKDVYKQDEVDGKDKVVKGDIDPTTLRKPDGTTTTSNQSGTGDNTNTNPSTYNAWMAGRRGFGRGTGAPVFMPLPTGALMEGWDYTRDRRGPLGLGGRRETWSYKGMPDKEDKAIDIAAKPSPSLIDYDGDGTPDSFPKRLPEEDYTGAQGEYEDLLRAQEMDKDNEALKVAMAREQEPSRVATDPLIEGMIPVDIKPGPNSFMYEQPAPSFAGPNTQQGNTAAPQKSLAQLKADAEAQMRAEGMDVDPAMMYNVGPQNSFVAPKGSQEWSEQQASAQDDDMQYQYGGVVELSQNEIDQILAMGGKVEYLD